MKIKSIWNKIRSNSLFIKVVAIVIISVVCVSGFTMSVAIHTSENVYISTFSKSNSQVIGQIKKNILQFNDEILGVMDVINNSWAFKNYLTSSDHTSKLASYTIYSMIKHLNSALPPNSSDKMNILVLGFNGSSYVGNSAILTTPVQEILTNQITKNALKNPKTVMYQYCDKGFTSLTQGDSVIIAGKILTYPGTKQAYGIVYIMIKQKAFQSFFSNFSSGANNILIMDDNGTIVSASLAKLINTKDFALMKTVKQIEMNNINYENTTLNSKQATVIAQHIPYLNYDIVGLIDRDAVLWEINQNKSIVVMGVIIALIVILIMFFIIRKTTKPISALVKRMPGVTNGDFTTHIPITGSYEAKELSAAFNYMLDGVNSYVDKLMDAQNEKRKAEIHALQMQIHPHFIYNTLTSVKWLVWQGETEKSSQVIDSFISLLHNTISNKNEMISAAEEMENLKNYVFLQHIRFGNQINVDFFLADGCEHCLMPKLILQPFLENSFFHAFREASSGNIHVFISRRSENLISEIMDDGTGIQQSEIDQMLSQGGKNGDHFTGIGIGNVNDRLKLLYGEKYGVSISSELNKGTIVTVTIPIQENPENKSPENFKAT